MDVFGVLLMLLTCFEAFNWSGGALKQEVDKGREGLLGRLWSQHLREALIKKGKNYILVTLSIIF